MAVTNNPLLRAFWRLHRRLLASSGGRFWTRLGPGRQLLLIAKGRKSGELRPVALSYVEHGDNWVVVASNVGEDRHPAWWLNLKANPHVEVLVNGERISVSARLADGEERTPPLSAIHRCRQELRRVSTADDEGNPSGDVGTGVVPNG